MLKKAVYPWRTLEQRPVLSLAIVAQSRPMAPDFAGHLCVAVDCQKRKSRFGTELFRCSAHMDRFGGEIWEKRGGKDDPGA